MASAAAPSTPARAIQTQLKTRSSPPIPPSSRVYDPIVKSVLRHRLTNSVFLYSALYTWAVASTWEIWERSGDSTSTSSLVPFLPTTLLKAGVGWIAGAVPAIVLRKLYLSPTRTNSVTRTGLVKAGLSQSQTPRVVFTYAASAIVALLVNVITVYAADSHIYSDPKLAPFVRSRKHPYYLNGRFLFLLLSQILAAISFCFRNITADRFSFSWKSSTTENTRPKVIHFIAVAIVALCWSTVGLLASGVLFSVARLLLPILYKLPILPHFLRPFTAHFLRGSFTFFLPLFHIPLLFRAWFLAFTTISTWEFANVFFETCIQQPVTVASSSAEPDVALAAGVSSPDLVFRFYAYLELQKLAAEDTSSTKTLRGNIFNDQKHTPSLWSQLARESLLQLGRDYQLFLRRGLPEPTAAPAPAPAPAAAGPKFDSTPISLIKTSVFKQNKPSPISNVITSLGSDGTLAQALDEGAEAAHIPQIFKSVEQTVIPPSATEAISKSVAVTMSPSVVTQVKEQITASVKGAVDKYAPAVVRKGLARSKVWWTRERVNKFVQSTLPHLELDLAVVDVLSHMVCASLSEDKYGVVQRDIPKIIEALVSFRSVVGEYRVEVKGKYVPPPADKELTKEEIADNETLRGEINAAVEMLGLAEAGLTEGIARIVRTFGPKLSAFRFPPRIAQQLQTFVDYC